MAFFNANPNQTVYGYGDSRMRPNNANPTVPTNGGGNTPPGMPTRGGTPGGGITVSGTAPTGGAYGGSQALVSGSNPYGGAGGDGSMYRPPGDALAAGGGMTYPNQAQAFPNMGAVQNTASAILPDIYRQPFLEGVSAAGTTGSFAGAALPGASQFQQGLYADGLNPMEQAVMNSSTYLGSLGLEQAFNEISGEYALDPYNSGKNKAYYDAANQFAAQTLQTGSQLGLDRMKLATQNLPNVFNFPNQAAQYGQQSAAGLYNAYDQALLGDTKLGYNMWSNYPITGSTYVQPPAPTGGK